jgi:hypothetical protein
MTTREGNRIVRKLTAALAALATAVGLTLVVAASAEAALTNPANGATVRGNFTMDESGLGDGSLCINATKSNVTFSLINSSNATVYGPLKVDAVNAVSTPTIDSHAFPNGTYTARAVEQKRTGTIICSNSSTTINNTITIQNITNLAMSNTIVASAPQNTSVTVSATLTDPNLAAVVLPNRTVTFSLSGGTSVNATTDANGVATAYLPISGPPRTGATITASFAATSFYVGSSATRSIDVTKNDSTTTVAAPATVVHGQATSFTATVAAGNGTGTPTGTVQFKVDGTNLGAPVALASGTATSPSTSSLSTGSHAVTAVYGGDANFFGSTSAAKNQQVDKAATTTSLTDAPSPTVSGQAVTFTAHVAVVAPGVGALDGAVQFNIDGQPFGTAVPLGAGDDATLTVSNLATGNHDVVAVYNGTADFASSSSATVTHGVNKADTTVDLSTSNPSAVSGEPLTFTAQVAPVSPGAGTITGTVQFAVDGVDLGDPVPVSGGQAVSPVTHLTVGNHNVTANYSGDANFAGQSDALTQVVVAAQTTTSITSSPNPSVHGQPVVVHTEVTPKAPATGHPTGTIKFIVDGATYDYVDLVDGAADLTLAGLSTESHTIKAVYLSDDLNFFTSTSETITQVVNKASTKTTLTSSSPTAVFGQPVTFTASVSVLAPGAGSPSGTIVFKDGSTVIGTQPVSSATGEQASITVSNLSVAQHAISAVYSGDDDFNPSTGNVSQTVTRAQTSTVIASSANPAASGQAVQFTATVTPVAPGAGNPTGTVRFFVNGANLGSPAPVVGGVATSPNFASLTPGVYKVTATYSGDGNFVGSDGVLDQGAGQNVTKGQTSITVHSGPSVAAYGSAVTVTTDVTAVAPAQRKPTGVVQIWEGDELLGSSSLAPTSAATTSEATFVTTGLSAGTHSLTAVYVGNFNFTGSSATTTQTVDKVPTVTGIASSGSPAVYGDTVTFTATITASTGTPTGTVTFKEGSTVLGVAPVATVGGDRQASLAVAGLHTGIHAVKAVYSGDTSFGASSSPTFGQEITKAPTTIVAADTNNPGNGVPPRQNWIRAKLTDRYGNPMPGRTVSFSSAPIPARPAQHLCDAVTDANGIAECNDQVFMLDINLTPGETLLDIVSAYDATYAGDADTIGDTARGHEY